MTPEEELEILNDALYCFGFSHQRLKAIEEMAELTKELAKNDDMQHVAEEIADVLIMVSQMIMYYNIQSLVDGYKEKKLRRLRNLIFEMNYG